MTYFLKSAFHHWIRTLVWTGSLLLISSYFNLPLGYAEGGPGGPPGGPGGHRGPSSAGAPDQGGDNKTLKPEEDDYSGTPFTEYGEFNESDDEDSDARFFQNGRFFGVSLGLGFQTVDGYRGALWQGGFPSFDFKVHYWFDFNVAIDLGFTTSQFYYDTTVDNIGHMDVNLLRVGIDLKYYFDTKNLSSAISFASPYVLLGASAYSKTENSVTQATQDSDTSMGVSGGVGLEFAISPRKSYFAVEGKMHVVTFKDTYTSRFTSQNLPSLTGFFYSVTGSILFTW